MPITVEIVTPRGWSQGRRRLVHGAERDRRVRGASGHRPLLAAMRAGVVTASEKGKKRTLAIGPGFAESNGTGSSC